MSLKRLMKWLAIICLILILLLLVAGFVFLGPLRDKEGQHYLSTLHTAAKPLHDKCEILSKRTEKLLVEQQPDALTDTEKVTSEISRLSTDVRTELKRFEVVATQFETKPYLPTSTDYQKAVIAHNHANAAIAQIKETLNESDRLLLFLDRFRETEQPLIDKLAEFNSLNDLYALSGSSSALYVTGNTIRTQADRMEKMDVYPGLESIRVQAVAAHTRAAKGFDSLAFAFSPPNDSLIYAAAGEIEKATDENENANLQLALTLEKLPAFKDISDLPEKLSDL